MRGFEQCFANPQSSASRRNEKVVQNEDPLHQHRRVRGGKSRKANWRFPVRTRQKNRRITRLEARVQISFRRCEVARLFVEHAVRVKKRNNSWKIGPFGLANPGTHFDAPIMTGKASNSHLEPDPNRSALPQAAVGVVYRVQCAGRDETEDLLDSHDGRASRSRASEEGLEFVTHDGLHATTRPRRRRSQKPKLSLGKEPPLSRRSCRRAPIPSIPKIGLAASRPTKPVVDQLASADVFSRGQIYARVTRKCELWETHVPCAMMACA